MHLTGFGRKTREAYPISKGVGALAAPTSSLRFFGLIDDSSTPDSTAAPYPWSVSDVVIPAGGGLLYADLALPANLVIPAGSLLPFPPLSAVTVRRIRCDVSSRT